MKAIKIILFAVVLALAGCANLDMEQFAFDMGKAFTPQHGDYINRY